MAENFWDRDTPADKDAFWEGDRNAAQQDLPEGVTPSEAGAGRGKAVPPAAASSQPADTAPGLDAIAFSKPASSTPQAQGAPVITRTPSDTVMAYDGNNDLPEPRVTPQVEATNIALSRRAVAERTPIPGTIEPRRTEASQGARQRANMAELQGGLAGDGNAVSRVFDKTRSDIVEGAAGAVRAGAELVGADKVARVAAETAGAAGDFSQAMGAPRSSTDFGPKSPMPYLKEMGEGAASSLGQSALFATTFGAGAVIPLMSLQSAGAQYQAARQHGLSPGQALANALPYGAFEAVGEKLGGLDKAAKALNVLVRGGTKEQIKDAGQMLLSAGVREIPGEWVTYLGQTGVDLLPGIGIRQDLTGEQFLDGLRDTTVQAAMMGTAMGTGGAIATARAGSGAKPVPKSPEQLARDKGFLVREQQVQRLNKAGEKDVAAGLQRQLDTERAESELEAFAGRPWGQDEGFQQRYRELRTEGKKPAEAAARAAMTAAYGQIGQMANMNENAFRKTVEAAAALPLEKVPAFFERVTANLVKKGMVAPLPSGTIEGAVGGVRDDAVQTTLGGVYGEEAPTDTVAGILDMEGAQEGAPAEGAASEEPPAIGAPVQEPAESAGGAGATMPPAAVAPEATPEYSENYSAAAPRETVEPRAGRSPFAETDMTPNEAGAHAGASSPLNDKKASTAQILAGNAPLGHMRVGGMGFSVENTVGSVREDKHHTPPDWKTPMEHGFHYGYFKRTEAADSTEAKRQGVDAFVQEGIPENYNGPVYVIDQVGKDGRFDEHKAIVADLDETGARAAYLAHYEPGWTGLGAITQFPTFADFKKWVRDGKKTEPAGTLGAAAPAPDAPAAAGSTGVAPDAGAVPAGGDAGEAPAAVAPLRLGTTPSNADPVTVQGGVVHVGKYEAVDYDSGEPVRVREGASHDEIRAALRKAGAVPGKAKFFGGEKAVAAATEPKENAPAAPVVSERLQSAHTGGVRAGAATDSTAAAPPQGAGSQQAPAATSKATEGAEGDKPGTGQPETPAAAAPAGSPSQIWNGTNPTDREPFLLAAGWKKGSPKTRELAQMTWREFTAVQKEKLSAAILKVTKSAPAAAPSPQTATAPSEKQVAKEVATPKISPQAAPAPADTLRADNQRAIRESGAEARRAGQPRSAPGWMTGESLQLWNAGWDGATPKIVTPQIPPAPPARRAQPGEPGYTLLDARNDLIAMRNELAAQTVQDDRLASRVRQMEKVVRDMEVAAAPAAPAAEPTVSANKVFTEDAAAAARALLKKKLGTLNSGLDPEMMQAGITLAGYHIEKGARTFAAYAQAMLGDLGDAVRPYLKSWYMGVKYDPRAADFSGEMSSAAFVEEFDVAAIATPAAGPNEAPAVENPAPSADTVDEAPDDSTPPDQPPADDRNLAPIEPRPDAGGTAAVRGAAFEEDAPAGRADDGGVRQPDGRDQGPDAVAQGLGDGGSNSGVPQRRNGGVERSGERDLAGDFRAPAGSLTREGSWFATAKRNIDLIELALKIDAEKRAATPEEQAQLAKYVGFGASEIRNALFPIPHQYARQQEPDRLIWPNLVDARWKPLAERLDQLPREWQQSVLKSTQYAHYTSEGIVRSVWAAVQRMGFTGGKILEPGAGIGNFVMAMPERMRRPRGYTGIEMDGPTALIARLLSPGQNMLHEDFIKRKLPRDFFDLAIGNPPFSQTKILGDPDYEKHGFMLHDFFFAKSIDRVRPGGLLVFVTSKGTMDKQTDRARKYLADRADLIGAIRLPSTAFEANAGTSVVADVIFLRKREEGAEPAGEKWTDVATVETKDGPVVVNEYFAAHPDMVLGQQRISGNQDDEGRRINSNGRGGEKYTVVSYDKTPEELDAKFAAAVQQLPQNVYSTLKASAARLKDETRRVDYDPKVKREGVVYADGGKLMRVEGGIGKEMVLNAKDAEWFKSYVALRDLVQVARKVQADDGDWEPALKALNKGYDAFVKKHGPINDYRTITRKSTDEDGEPVETTIRVFKNNRLLRQDYDQALMISLERIDESGKIHKSAFLQGRTIGKPPTREVKTVGDALAVSLDELGRLELADVAQRLHITEDEAIDALGTNVYKAPSGEWQLSDEYLSGDVVAKLEEAQTAARIDPSLERNIEALKAVQPERLGPSQISVKLGASWVPAEYVSEFAKEIGAGAVTFDSKTESWQVQGGNERSARRAGLEYGTAARSPSELLEAALNSRQVVVKTKDADKKEVTDTEATTAANETMRKIKERFKSWVWTDTDRAATLVESYNRRFNNIAPRRFDGSHLTLPGVSLRFKLHPHQLRAIWRQIQTGNTYLAHAVGAGKTIEMIAGGMEQKRLGLIRKPIYVVPNHMLEQFSNEFMELYPLANIMVADDENFSADRRKQFVAAATLNAPDAIVITQSAFERVGVTEASVAPIRDEILSDLQDELDDVGKGDRVRRSQLEQQIEAVEQRFDSIVGMGKKDNVIPFEEMGVDFIYADEAHAYRKLDFSTNQKIKGIDPQGSRRALDMYVKTRVLQKRRPGRAFTFASGTPVTNTMGELFTLMRFFVPEEMARTGITSFDSWARQFGEVGVALEANAAGRYENVTRFSKFDNVPELMSRVRTFMDVLTSEHLGALVKRPDLEGGKPNLVLVEATKALKDYMKNVLSPRLEASRAWKPSKDEPFNPDPVLAIISDGRFAALDPRFFGGKPGKDEASKLDEMAGRIVKTYLATGDNVYVDKDSGKDEPVKGATQIVFYNLGFGAGSMANRGFDARAHLTKQLTAGGVKREHILWFDDANTDAKKESMFQAMRTGKARILIGSAKKMGTGVNVQKRLVRLHYFDPPWYPSDVEQPHGRIIRQGNQNALVGIDWYATKGAYDSTMWQMVGRKQRFIDQAFSGDKTLRSMEDMSEASQYEQAAAMASGDPRALQLAGYRQDVERLERLQAAHANEQIAVRDNLRSVRWYIDSGEKRIAELDAALKVLGGSYFAWTRGTVGERVYEKQGEFGQAVKEAFNRLVKKAEGDDKRSEKPVPLGALGPVKVMGYPHWRSVRKEDETPDFGGVELVAVVGDERVSVLDAVSMGDSVDAVGLARKILNAINGLSSELDRRRRELASNQDDEKRLKKKQGVPFEHQQEMLEKYAALKQLENELRAEGEADAKAQAAANAAAKPLVVDETGGDGNTPPAGDEPPQFARGSLDGSELRDAVLAKYPAKMIERIDGHAMLAAKLKKAGAPIFVMRGTFNRDAYKRAIAEAKAAGIDASGKMYVYADMASYSGKGIEFLRLGDMSLPAEGGQLARAFHGTPHDFDAFTTERIGTGEGAQAFGWGMYFAENEGVADHYRRTLSREVLVDGKPANRMTTGPLNLFIVDMFKNRKIAGLSDEAARAQTLEWAKRPGQIKQALGDAAIEKYVASLSSNPGQLFQVDIPDEAVAGMLLWDKPLADQPAAVRAALEKLAAQLAKTDPKNHFSRGVRDGLKGEVIYRYLAQELAPNRSEPQTDGVPQGWGGFVQTMNDMVVDDRAASQKLDALGIPGIKFLDGASRNRSLREIKREFLEQLPEDADFDEVLDLIGSGTFSPHNEAILKELAANDWLGFDFPAQAISAALGGDLANFDASPELVQAVANAQSGASFNFVVFNDKNVRVTHKNGTSVTAAERAEALAQFSRSDVMPSGLTMQQARDRIREMRGANPGEVNAIAQAIAANWKGGPPVRVVPTYRDLPVSAPADARGLHYNGTVYVVAAAHRSGAGMQRAVAMTVAHEAIAHYGLEHMLGRKDFDRLVTKPMQLALASGNKPLLALREHVRAVYRDKQGRYLLNAYQEADEMAARAVELAVDQDGNFRPGFSWLKDLWAKVAQVLRSMGFNVEFTRAELHGMLVAAARGLERGKRHAGGGVAVLGERPAFAYAGYNGAFNQGTLDTLDEAVRWEKEGAAQALIRRKTGWFKGPHDGRWRFEMADNGARLVGWEQVPESKPFSDAQTVPLEQVLEHPALFRAYPQARALKVLKRGGFLDFGGLQGWFDGKDTFGITPYAKDPLSTLLHEVQHWIQSKEGFASGGNENTTFEALSLPQRKKLAGKVLAEFPKKIQEAEDDGQATALAMQLRDMPEMKAAIAAEAEFQRIAKEAPTGDPARNAAFHALNAADATAYAAIAGKGKAGYFDLTNVQRMAYIRAKPAGRDLEKELDTAQTRVLKLMHMQAGVKAGDMAALKEALSVTGQNFGLYRALAGEIEARDVQARQQMTEKQRKETPPFSAESFAPEDVIVRFKQQDDEPASESREQFARGEPDLFGGWEVPEDTTTDKVLYELQDGRIDLKRVQQAIASAGGEIEQRFDARLAETLYPGRVARRTENFLRREAKPLLEAMARIGATQDELGDYLIARHAPERNAQVARVNPDLPDGGAGRNSRDELMTTEAAEAYIAAIPDQRRRLLEELANYVDRITAGTRELLVAEGLEKRRTVDAWQSAYEHYVPLFKQEAEDGAHPQGMGFTVRGPASKRSTGSTKQVQNVLAHVLMQREAAIARAEKNRVGMALYGLALSHPNRDFWTTIKPGMTEGQVTRELQRIGVDATLARSGMSLVPTIRDVSDVTGEVVDRPNPLYKSLPGAITLRVNGEDRVLMLNVQDPRGARLAADLKNMDGLTRLNLAGSIIGKSTRWLAAVNTQYNPAFGLANLTRDTWGGLVNLGSTKLRGRSIEVLSHVPMAMKGITMALATHEGARGAWEQLWQQFQDDGGRTGWREAFRRADERTAALEKELQRAESSGLLQKAGYLPGKMLGFLDGFNTVLENAVRLAAYKTAIDKGIPRPEAARLARELTVDFNRKGRSGRELQPLYAFFNASVQGGARTIETLKGPTGKAVIAGGLTLGVIQALALLAAGYDEDEIPEWVITRSLVIPLPRDKDGGKRFFSIPLPLGLHVLPNTGRILTELGLSGGKDGAKRLTRAVGEIASAFNPLGGGNIFTAHGALTTVAPTVIDPIVDIAANRNFAGTPIERQSFRGEEDNRPGYQRARERTQRSLTGQAYIEASRILNAATGGTAFERGAVSPTPERIRYIAETVGGGVLRELEKSIDSGYKAAHGEKVEPFGIPVLGRFYGEVDAERVVQSRYFDRGRKIDRIEQSLGAAKKAGDGEAILRLASTPEAQMAHAHNQAEKSLAALNKLAGTTINDREQMRQIDAARVATMKGLNDAIEAMEQGREPPTPRDKLGRWMRGEPAPASP